MPDSVPCAHVQVTLATVGEWGSRARHTHGVLHGVFGPDDRPSGAVQALIQADALAILAGSLARRCRDARDRQQPAARGWAGCFPHDPFTPVPFLGESAFGRVPDGCACTEAGAGHSVQDVLGPPVRRRLDAPFLSVPALSQGQSGVRRVVGADGCAGAGGGARHGEQLGADRAGGSGSGPE
jgi:hypothetical protein